jgi:hypothetical protein
VPGSYRVAPIFLIRMAGVPFDVLDHLGTPGTVAAARALFVRREEFAKAKSDAERLLRRRDHGLSVDAHRALQLAVRASGLPASTGDAPPPESVAYAAALGAITAAEIRLQEALERELNVARTALLESSRRVLPPYLVFAAGPELLARLLGRDAGEGTPPSNRNARARERERHLLLYLQRVCAKNDTFSAFGPSAWGSVRIDKPLAVSSSASATSRRDIFLERWTAHTVAAAMNADPEIRAELSPRLHPNGRIEGNQLIFTDTGETTPLESETIALLNRCNGKTPAHALGVPHEALEDLAQRDILRWEMEVPALEPHAFSVLISEIRQWRDNAVRARWLKPIEDIARLPLDFARDGETSARVKIMGEARQRLRDLGGARDSTHRFLYAATNPIAEECFRESAVEIPEAMTDDLARDAAPWIDLWRDTYAFVASRVAAGLRTLFQTAPIQNGAVPLPGFLKHCEMQRMPLTGPGIVALAHIAFQEVKAAFRKEVEQRAAHAELVLSEHDCHFVRRNFAYEKFDEYTYPSADLQVSARSTAEAAAGNYQWIVSELHSAAALLHHCFYWSCPDQAQLSRALASTTFGRPAFHYGFFAADFTAHTAVRLIDALPELVNFVAPQPGKSHWNIVPPAEVEVYIDEQTGDVCARKRDSSQYLGSFARSWLIPVGIHPFQFGRAPHMPRLRCGRVIVQRRSWTVTMEELPPGNYTGISRDLVLAIERLRAVKDWPRYVYIRPSEQALRRSGAEGRDKDTKPVFIDLESYLFLEIFYRWLTKAGELEVTEMLPDPEHLLWQEKDGRRTFELRSQIVPR